MHFELTKTMFYLLPLFCLHNLKNKFYYSNSSVHFLVCSVVPPRFRSAMLSQVGEIFQTWKFILLT